MKARVGTDGFVTRGEVWNDVRKKIEDPCAMECQEIGSTTWRHHSSGASNEAIIDEYLAAFVVFTGTIPEWDPEKQYIVNAQGKIVEAPA